MAKRITDLDKFSLEQIWRPYKTRAGIDEKTDLSVAPMSLDDTAEKLTEDTEWSRLVLSRIRACKFYFPSYVKHRLVDIVRGKP
jgi:hypothetical protein